LDRSFPSAHRRQEVDPRAVRARRYAPSSLGRSERQHLDACEAFSRGTRTCPTSAFRASTSWAYSLRTSYVLSQHWPSSTHQPRPEVAGDASSATSRSLPTSRTCCHTSRKHSASAGRREWL
jgi:hypothetical protein